jgi:hypothetical protein
MLSRSLNCGRSRNERVNRWWTAPPWQARSTTGPFRNHVHLRPTETGFRNADTAPRVCPDEPKRRNVCPGSHCWALLRCFPRLQALPKRNAQSFTTGTLACADTARTKPAILFRQRKITWPGADGAPEAAGMTAAIRIACADHTIAPTRAYSVLIESKPGSTLLF